MLVNLVFFLSCDYLFGFWISNYYRWLNNLSIIGAILIYFLPWNIIFDEIGLGFIGTFMTILGKGFCPLAQATGNTVLLLLGQCSLGAIDPPFFTMCQENGSFSNNQWPLIVIYFTLFGSMDIIVRFFQSLFGCCQRRSPLLEQKRERQKTCSDGKKCVHYQALESINKHINYNLNMEK